MIELSTGEIVAIALAFVPVVVVGLLQLLGEPWATPKEWRISTRGTKQRAAQLVERRVGDPAASGSEPATLTMFWRTISDSPASVLLAAAPWALIVWLMSLGPIGFFIIIAITGAITVVIALKD